MVLGFKKESEGKQVSKKKGKLIMDILNFIIAIVALVVAVMAFQRTGGTKDLRKNTAELLAKMEKRMREEEASEVVEEKTSQ
jgi:cell division protein FtsL